jgi:hypothetical protein
VDAARAAAKSERGSSDDGEVDESLPGWSRAATTAAAAAPFPPPRVWLGAAELHLERLLARALEPPGRGSRPAGWGRGGNGGGGEAALLPAPWAALLPALVLVPCATAAAAEAAAANVLAVLQRIDRRLRRPGSASDVCHGSSSGGSRGGGLWIEVFDPALAFLEACNSGGGGPGVGSGAGGDGELGPRLKAALDRCFRAAVRRL